MAPPGICPQCGDRLPADVPHGVCPKCLLGLGFNEPEPAGTGGFQPTLDPSGRFDAPTPEVLAEQFPQLEILELIGQGGMGAVYRARQKTLDRVVALKVLPTDVGRDPAFAERFMREARALARLTHPNIVMVFDFGESSGYYYFIMEYVDGVNLRQALQAGRLSSQQALDIVPQVCEALQFAHDEGIVHRDIKPENVLLDKRGNVKIADFGLAKLLGRPAGRLTLTGTGQIMGTPQYMAPEQMEKPLTVDHRADIYSLGVVFYELLTGELPIGRFPPPSCKSGVSADLDEVVLRTLEKEPSRRYQQASEVKTAVEAVSSAPAANQPSPPLTPRENPLRVPFSIKDVYGGLAKCEGIARFDGQVLTLEFEVKDDVVGYVSSGIKSVAIPISEIVSLERRPTWLRSRNVLELRVDKLNALRKVPRSERGCVSLRISRQDFESAKHLAAAVQQSLGAPSHQCADASSSSKPPVARPGINLDAARRDVRGPATGLLVVGVLNCLNSLVMIGLVAPALTIRKYAAAPATARIQRGAPETVVTIQARDDTAPNVARAHSEAHSADRRIVVAESQRVEPPPVSLRRALEPALLPIWIALACGLLFPLTVAVFVLLGSVKMKRLEGYGWCLTAGILVVLPLHPWFFLGLPLGIWALVTLSRRETREAFREQAKQPYMSAADPGPEMAAPVARPAKPIGQPAARAIESLRTPAIGLIIVGSINVVAFFGLWLAALWFGGFATYFIFLILLVPLIMGLLQLKGGLHMLNRKSYITATAGAVAAILPLTVLWPVSLVLGVWTLIVLQRDDVKQLFHTTGPGYHDPMRRQRSSPAVAAVFLMIAFFTLMGVSLAAYFLSHSRTPEPHAPVIISAESSIDPQPRPSPVLPEKPSLPPVSGPRTPASDDNPPHERRR